MERPSAPCCIASATSVFIFMSSAGVALRFAVPITASRTVPWPTKSATFGDTVAAATLSNHGAIGSGELPSLPSTTVVSPCSR